jgi:hypothetical protein
LALNCLVPALQTLLFLDPRPLVERLGLEFFRQLPARPGVYLMQDAAQVVRPCVIAALKPSLRAHRQL